MSWLSALRGPAFRRVWLVGTLLQFGYWFSSISFQWLVARATDNDPLSLSVLYFCVLAPMLLFSLPAGVLADVRDRRLIIILAQAGVIGVSLVTGTLVLLDWATAALVMACGFAAGTVHTLAVPASQALVALAVPAEQLRSGILLHSAGVNLARVTGPPAASVLILGFGTANSLLAYGAIGAVTILVARGAIGGALRTAPSAVAGPTDHGMVRRIGSGLRHARGRPLIAGALLIVAVTSAFGLSYSAQLPALAARVSPDPSTFLMLATVAGIGAAAGVVLGGLRTRGSANVTAPAIMLALQGIVVMGLGLAQVLWLVVVLLLVGGALQFGIMTSSNTVIQSVVDEQHRGRVMSLYLLCWGGLLPIGGLLLGVLWHLFGPVLALVSSGAIALAVAIAILLRARLRQT